MERRTFLTSILGTTLAGAAAARSEEGQSTGQTAGKDAAPEFYLWRQYSMRNGTQPRRLADFLQKALIPATNRLGHSPVGVFEVVAGFPSQTVFVLTPFSALDAVGTFETRLERDQQFMDAAGPYIDAVAADPIYLRQELSLFAAMPNVPRVEVPAATAARGPRLFELRTYESHNERAHRAKVRMFAELGEVDIFRRVGLTPVFFARTIVGPRMPNLIYMLVHDNMAAREKSWDTFRNDPEWKKLASTPGFADAEIVSNITTAFLRPAAYSQI